MSLYYQNMSSNSNVPILLSCAIGPALDHHMPPSLQLQHFIHESKTWSTRSSPKLIEGPVWNSTRTNIYFRPMVNTTNVIYGKLPFDVPREFRWTDFSDICE